MKICCVGSHLFEPTHNSIGSILLGIQAHAEIDVWAKKPLAHPMSGVPMPRPLDLPSIEPPWRPQADVVHAISAGVTAIRVAEKLADDVPLVVSVAGGADLSRELVDPHLTSGYAFLFERVSAITVPFRQATEALIAAGAPRQKIVEIPLGLPAPSYPAHAPGPRRTALWAGRRRHRKNRPLALETLAASDSMEELILVGGLDGTEGNVHDQRASFRGELEHADFVPLMASSHVLLQTGWTEGDEIDTLPTVILEALAVGLPVVSTPLSGVRELAERHPDHVLLGDSAATLAAACERIWARGAADTTAVSAEILAHHSLTAAVDRFLQLYRRLLG